MSQTLNLEKFFQSNLLFNIRQHHDQLVDQGACFNSGRKNRTDYKVQLLETSFEEKNVCILLAQSAGRIFADVYSDDKSFERLRDDSSEVFPQMSTILNSKASLKGVKVTYTGEIKDARLRQVVALFTKKTADTKKPKKDPGLGNTPPKGKWSFNMPTKPILGTAIVAGLVIIAIKAKKRYNVQLPELPPAMQKKIDQVREWWKRTPKAA